MNENTYTSFDLMKTFLDFLLLLLLSSFDNFVLIYHMLVDYKQIKFVYNQQAYDILKQNYQKKIVEEVRENPKMFSLIQENETLKATLSEYKQISSKFETMYNEEKAEKENLINEKATLQATNSNYIEKNHKLEEEKYKLEQEIERMKNRGFFARLLNK